MSDARQLAKAHLDRRIKACRKCKSPDQLNIPGATASAPGFGSINSPVAIVGEALCRRCMDKQEPFYGGSGRVLDRCFTRAGKAKTDLFITNSIHCHPPGRRGLRKRLDEYGRFGAGEPAPHPPPVTTTPRPSRLMPSSGLSCDFEKTSRSHAAADAAGIESEMIAAFRAHHGVRPFANARN